MWLPLQVASADYLVTLRNAFFDAGVNRIVRISDGGVNLGDFVPASQVMASGLSGPTGLIYDVRGDLQLTSTFGNQVLRFDGSTGMSLGVLAPGMPPPNPMLDGPSALRATYSTSGVPELLVGHLGSAGGGFMGMTVSRLQGNTGAFLGNFGSGHLGVSGLLSRGVDTYVSQLSSNQVLRFDSLGVLQQTITDSLIVGPTGMAFDPNTGHLLIASVNSDQIVQYDGTTTTTYLSTPPMFFPSGIRFINNNEFLVSSSAVGTILKYTVGNPIPTVLIDYLGFGLTQTDLLNGVAVGDILRYQPGGAGDFDGNGTYQCADVDGLVSQIVGGNYSDRYDLNDDSRVDTADLRIWRAMAGAALTVSGNPIREGDANLDGVVDGTDFGVWNTSKFTAQAAWCRGDFSADGMVDGTDFGIWNTNKFTSSDTGPAAVPEPVASVLILGCLVAWISRSRGWSHNSSLT